MSIVLQKAYKKALRDEFASGRLENASSKASVLNELCYRLGMSLDVALKINKEILKQRFEQFLEKGSLCDTEEIELTKLRLLLCIKKEVVSDFKREMCGRLYGLTIESFFKLGIYSISLKERELVRKRKFELRLDDDMASQIIHFEARKVLMQFVSAYRNKIKRHDASKELRNMILFSNFVVSPILDDGQGNGEKNLISRSEQKDKHPKVWKIDSFNKKNEKNISLQESSYQLAYHKIHGKKLNLIFDLDLKDRLIIYKNYLQYCITGDVVKLGLGSTIVLEKNQKEFAYLKKLGDILGLNNLNIANTHQNIAETAFKMQEKQIFI
jgi:hypothetical protein